ncbi:MAG: nickel-dependent hydrogenase large subunit [Gammaproteobacteria bacterium]|nr:nickel-dependent hydrogenase large subunit [Gammaproteobacteria bacterium]
MTTRRVVPFNRVEGDLELRLKLVEGVVASAQVVAPLYRGFEQLLQGQQAADALVFVPRICGICSVAQSHAAAAALAALAGGESPANGRRVSRIVLATENLADHLTHFYLFFMPDFARSDYRHQPWYEAISHRFRAQQGAGSGAWLQARAQLMQVMGILAGKWPHTLGLQPGGVTRAVTAEEKVRLQTLLYSFRTFIEEELFAADLEQVVALESDDALQQWRQERERGDFGQFLTVAAALSLEKMGQIMLPQLSFGAYATAGGHFFRQGVAEGEAVRPVEDQAIGEDLSHCWLPPHSSPQHPFHGVTQPGLEENPDGYSWCKAPRLGGRAVEVGAIARQRVDGQPLLQDLYRRDGSSVYSRVVARLIEVARITVALEQWIAAIDPAQPFYRPLILPPEGTAVGAVEAARGSLGHWLRVGQGRIENYQIIAPTTWNFSPRDGAGVPGALEQALAGTVVGDRGEDAPAIAHIVRSFDPCMVCTVH